MKQFHEQESRLRELEQERIAMRIQLDIQRKQLQSMNQLYRPLMADHTADDDDNSSDDREEQEVSSTYQPYRPPSTMECNLQSTVNSSSIGNEQSELSLDYTDISNFPGLITSVILPDSYVEPGQPRLYWLANGQKICKGKRKCIIFSCRCNRLNSGRHGRIS